MNISKRLIGWTFFLFAFLGAGLAGYIQIVIAKYPSAYLNIIMWTYNLVWIGLMFSWDLLATWVKKKLPHEFKRKK